MGMRVVFRGRAKFLSTPSARRATPDRGPDRAGGRDFYPRPPRGGRPLLHPTDLVAGNISIHALREEGDVNLPASCVQSLQFLSTPSARRATNFAHITNDDDLFLSTPSARRATESKDDAPENPAISIHALREEGDTADGTVTIQNYDFYPRPPRGGRQDALSCTVSCEEFLSTPSARRATSNGVQQFAYYNKEFLSTPSARRATLEMLMSAHPVTHFYPRPPRGGRPLESQPLSDAAQFLSTPSARRATPRCTAATACPSISIHALREEGDQSGAVTIAAVLGFLSTPSARRATAPVPHGLPFPPFLSTPSARRATGRHGYGGGHCDFYPRPPRGGRLSAGSMCNDTERFLSTPSARRATAPDGMSCGHCGISIHALREEGDWSEQAWERGTAYFYPRPPRGGRPGEFVYFQRLQFISIHALREEGDRYCSVSGRTAVRIFLSTPSARRATRHPVCCCFWRVYFYPRPPRGGRHAKAGDSLTVQVFLSTPSARRATGGYKMGLKRKCIFLSTPSARRAT